MSIQASIQTSCWSVDSNWNSDGSENFKHSFFGHFVHRQKTCKNSTSGNPSPHVLPLPGCLFSAKNPNPRLFGQDEPSSIHDVGCRCLDPPAGRIGWSVSWIWIVFLVPNRVPESQRIFPGLSHTRKLLPYLFPRLMLFMLKPICKCSLHNSYKSLLIVPYKVPQLELSIPSKSYCRFGLKALETATLRAMESRQNGKCFLLLNSS